MRLRVAGIVASLVAVATAAVSWPFLPEKVPVHWNAHGDVDRWSTPLEFVLVGPGLVIGMWALMEILLRIDPRRRGPQGGARELVLSVAVAMIAATYLLGALAAVGVISDMARAVILMMGLFLVLLGNWMGRVRPNWFAGIRTPWTLENDEVWRRTNRFAGRVFVGAGVASVALALAISGPALAIAFIALAFAATMGPMAYSYLLWRRLARG